MQEDRERFPSRSWPGHILARRRCPQQVTGPLEGAGRLGRTHMGQQLRLAVERSAEAGAVGGVVDTQPPGELRHHGLRPIRSGSA